MKVDKSLEQWAAKAVADSLAAARREGVIQGLVWALACVETRGQQTRPLPARVEILRAEIERLKSC